MDVTSWISGDYQRDLRDPRFSSDSTSDTSWGQGRPRSLSLQPQSQHYRDIQSVSTATRWYPEYIMPGGASSEGRVPRHRSGLNMDVSSFLSTIPEDSLTSQYDSRDFDLDRHTSRIAGRDYGHVSPTDRVANKLFARRYSESDLPRVPPDRMFRNNEMERSTDYWKSVSNDLSEDGSYLSMDSERLRSSSFDMQNMDSVDSPAITGESNYYGRKMEQNNKNPSAHLQFPERRSSQPDRKGVSVNPDVKRRSSQPNLEGQASPFLIPSNSSSSSMIVSGLPSGSDRRSSDSSRKSVTSILLTPSSLAGSRRQSIFEVGGSAISAEMVSDNPAAAASVAFATLELTPELQVTLLKQLSRVCSSVFKCFLVVTLAASLIVAIYFAVTLNRAQSERIEFLRATLNFHLSETSEHRLTSMSTSERIHFDQQYCREIDSFFRNSSLSDDYQSCEVASIQNRQLKVVLYFDERSMTNTSLKQENVILQVLVTSAPRAVQDQSDVISINNLPVTLTATDISVEGAAEPPNLTLARENTKNLKADNSEDANNAALRTVPGKRQHSDQEQSSTERQHTTQQRHTTQRPSATQQQTTQKQHNATEQAAQDQHNATEQAAQEQHNATEQVAQEQHNATEQVAQEQHNATEQVAQEQHNAKENPQLGNSAPGANRVLPCAAGERGTYYRHPSSCSLYFLCLEGRSITLTCGVGLVFDLHRKVCAQEAPDCVQSKESEFYGHLHPDALQPCENKGGDYYPHPGACNLYIQCSSAGTSVVHICPDDLVFSAQIQTCARLDKNIFCPQLLANQSAAIDTSRSP